MPSKERERDEKRGGKTGIADHCVSKNRKVTYKEKLWKKGAKWG